MKYNNYNQVIQKETLRLAAALPGYARKNISVREACCDNTRVIL